MKALKPVLVIGVICTVSLALWLILPPFFEQLSYKKLTLREEDLVTVEFDGKEYFFLYYPLIDSDHFGVSTHLYTKEYAIVEGAVYEGLGLEMQVLEAHSDYIVLQVKPLP